MTLISLDGATITLRTFLVGIILCPVAPEAIRLAEFFARNPTAFQTVPDIRNTRIFSSSPIFCFLQCSLRVPFTVCFCVDPQVGTRHPSITLVVGTLIRLAEEWALCWLWSLFAFLTKALLVHSLLVRQGAC